MSDNESQDSSFIVKLRGLPWTVTSKEILDFLEGVEVADGENGVHLITYSRNSTRPNGEAFVVCESEEDYKLAFEYNKKNMGHRYIEIFSAKREDFENIMRKQNIVQHDTVVKLRGLPWRVTEQEIADFFEGLELNHEKGIHIHLDRLGRASGEAFVQFESEEDCEMALKKNLEKIGHRYIEIFRSTTSELRRSMSQGPNENCANDNSGGYNNIGNSNNGGGNRPSPYDRNDRGDRGGNRMNNMNSNMNMGNNRNMRGGGNDRSNRNFIDPWTNNDNMQSQWQNRNNNNFGNFNNGSNGNFGVGNGGSNGNNGNGGFGGNSNCGFNSGGFGGGNFGNNSNLGVGFGGNNNGGGGGFGNGNGFNGNGCIGSGFGNLGSGNNRMGGIGNFGGNNGGFNGGNNGPIKGLGNGAGSSFGSNFNGGNKGYNNGGNGYGALNTLGFGNFSSNRNGNNSGMGNNGGNNYGGSIGGGMDRNNDSDDNTNSDLFCVHLRGMPYYCDELDIMKFFAPLKPVNCKVIYNNKGMHSGGGNAFFASNADVQQALQKDKEKMGSRYIELMVMNQNSNNRGSGSGNRRF